MIPRFRLYIVYVLLLLTAFFVHTHREITVPANRPLVEIPMRRAGWTMTGQTRFDERVLKILRPTDYLSRTYADENGNRVSFYLGYHAGGPDGGAIHSPKHCLPGSGWNEVNERKVSLPIGNESLKLARAVYQNGDAKEMFLYWYQVKGRSLDNEYSLKVAEVINSIFKGRRESAFVRISIPFETDEEKAFQVGARFIEAFHSEIVRVLPK